MCLVPPHRHRATPLRITAPGGNQPKVTSSTGCYGDKNNEFHDLVTGHVFKDDGTHTGYVLGGGLEYLIAPGWSVKAEYQYIDLGLDNATDGLGEYVRTKDTELNTVRGGVNYHFSSPLEPLK